MSKQHLEGLQTDNKSATDKTATGSAALDRRTLLIVAGQTAAACTLAACGGRDMTNGTDLGVGKDLRGPGFDLAPSDIRQPPDEAYLCVLIVATDAEKLAVGNAKSFYNSTDPSKSFLVARDSKGFFALQNVCTHASCQMSYNGTAKTYDCSCHGSRFNLDGTVLNGPAKVPLRSYPMTKLGNGTLEVNPCGLGSTDLSGRVT